MEWIVIDAVESPTKTKRFKVYTTDRCMTLGEIRFYPRWRKYAFYPNNDTLYECDCLRDIAQFCQRETEMWRSALTGAMNRQ